MTNLSLRYFEIESQITDPFLGQYNFLHDSIFFTFGGTAGDYAALGHFKAGGHFMKV